MSAVAALDVYALGLAAGGDTLRLRLPDGRERPLSVGRWLGGLTAADDLALSRVRGPVLDVGCGPGRHVHALARQGVLALGLDICPEAVRLARRRGAAVLHGSVFDDVPGAGEWGSALLLDGNVGIGGRPERLLSRVASLLRPGGRLVVEVGPPGSPTRSDRVRLVAGDVVSTAFDWAEVGADDLDAIAGRAGLRVSARTGRDGRWFAELEEDDDPCA